MSAVFTKVKRKRLDTCPSNMDIYLSNMDIRLSNLDIRLSNMDIRRSKYVGQTSVQVGHLDVQAFTFPKFYARRSFNFEEIFHSINLLSIL